MKEDYVSFEVAKLLKEKGFELKNALELYLEYKDGSYCVMANTYSREYSGNLYPRTTLQGAMKWLREVHNISIEVVYDCSNDKTETISWWFANIKHINSSSSKENDCLTAYNSYEEAASSAIKYALENLI